MPSGKRCYEWDPQRLDALVKKTGMSYDEVARCAGIGKEVITSWKRGTVPGLSGLIILADFFAVPVDYFLGRTNKDFDQSMYENYEECFKNIRRASFEHYLSTKHRVSDVVEGERSSKLAYKTVWPYNAYEAIFNDYPPAPLSNDQVLGLEYAITCLDKREREIFTAFFKEGKRCTDIANKLNLTRARVYQILNQSVEKIRYPTFARCIELGYGLAQMENSSHERREALEAEEGCLDDWEERINQRKDLLKDIGDELGVEEKAFVMPQKLNMSTYELGLSNRAYNALCRAKLFTLKDVLLVAQKGELSQVRSMGEITMNEIISKIEKAIHMPWPEFLGRGGIPEC